MDLLLFWLTNVETYDVCEKNMDLSGRTENILIHFRNNIYRRNMLFKKSLQKNKMYNIIATKHDDSIVHKSNRDLKGNKNIFMSVGDKEQM